MRRVLQVILLFGMLVVMAGCGGNNTNATPTTPPSDNETGGTTQNNANRPSAPAGDDFRSDPAIWVANTGYPQVVEVFSYD